MPMSATTCTSPCKCTKNCICNRWSNLDMYSYIIIGLQFFSYFIL